MLGPFLMETPDGRQAASATKKSIFRREFNISQGERRYVLRSVSAFGCEYGLFVESRRVGLIVRKSWFRRRAMVEINDEVPLWLQAFAVWLALLLWKRDSDATVSLLAAAGS